MHKHDSYLHMVGATESEMASAPSTATEVYKKHLQDLGFEPTPIPTPPHGTTSMVMIKGYNAMDVDDEYGVEDFNAEIAALGDGKDNEEDRCVFPGYCSPVKTTWSKEEDGPLYRMEALTSEVEALMSSPKHLKILY